MPVMAKEPAIYAPGSLEASRTSSLAPVTDEAERRRLEILNPPPAPVVYEPINGPNAKRQYAPGSVEYARQQAEDRCRTQTG